MLNILHVDDNYLDLKITERSLNKINEGLSISSMSSPLDVIKNIMLENKYDCIISDYQMPVLNGLELLAIIRKMGIMTPFILMTGTIDNKIEDEAFKLGADGFIHKSEKRTCYDNLMDRIRALLNNNS